MITHNFSSSARTRGVIESFQIDLVAPITCRAVRVANVEIQNTLYNIGTKNYRLFMDIGVGDPYIYLTAGTYTAAQLCTTIQTKMRFHGMGLTGNTVTFANNKFTITSTTSFTIKPIPDNYDFASTMGFTATHTGTSAISDIEVYNENDAFIVEGSDDSSIFRFTYNSVQYNYTIPNGNYSGFDFAQLLSVRMSALTSATITVEYKTEHISFQFTAPLELTLQYVDGTQTWFGSGAPFTIPANTPTLVQNYQFFQVSHLLVKSRALTSERPVVLSQVIGKLQMDTVFGNTSYEKNLDVITYDRPTTLTTIDLRLEAPSGKIQEVQKDWSITLIFEL